jgi:hypothetical protein
MTILMFYQSQGYDVMTSKCKIVSDQLEPVYFAIVDAYKFTRSAVGVLQGANNISEFKVIIFILIQYV